MPNQPKSEFPQNWHYQVFEELLQLMMIFLNTSDEMASMTFVDVVYHFTDTGLKKI